MLTSTHRIRAARSLAACGSDPEHDLQGWRVRENVYWLVLHGRFDPDLFCAAHRRGRSPWLAAFMPGTLWGPKAAAYIKARLQELLLPGFMDMAGFWTAMAIATGLPPESINELQTSWFDTAPGGELTLLRYRKQRSGSPTSPLVLPARPPVLGPVAVRPLSAAEHAAAAAGRRRRPGPPVAVRQIRRPTR